MNIYNYKIFISNLTVRKQSFTTKRTNWNKAEKQIDCLNKLNDAIFGDNTKLTISRQDIFETKDLSEKIIKTIYWGYTGGMRGKYFMNILTNIIALIKNAIKKLNQKDQSTKEDFKTLTDSFKTLTGLGLSVK